MCFGSSKPPAAPTTEPAPIRRESDGPVQSTSQRLRRRATGFDRANLTSPLGVTNFGSFSQNTQPLGTVFAA